jgi:REP element-mobilizing transposase RayT
MNRGYDGNDIFFGHKNKSRFLDYHLDASKKMKIRIFAYCVMDNHYHMVLENTTGRMSDCLRLLNGNYGMYYRKLVGGKGYVFHDRFKSTLIENDAYLLQSIVYLLRNPLRAGIVHRAANYIWSSGSYYFSDKKTELVDAEFINELFGTKEALMDALDSLRSPVLEIKTTEYGEFMGSNDFIQSALKKFDRRKRPSQQSKGVQRLDERHFDPAEKIIMEFERMKGINIDDIDTTRHEGKRLRGELLVYLKENAGLKYKEIGEFDIFGDLSFVSLRSIYRNMKKNHLKA